MDIEQAKKVMQEVSAKIFEYDVQISNMRTPEGKAYYEAWVFALEAGNKALAKEIEQQTKGEYGF